MTLTFPLTVNDMLCPTSLRDRKYEGITLLKCMDLLEEKELIKEEHSRKICSRKKLIVKTAHRAQIAFNLFSFLYFFIDNYQNFYKTKNFKIFIKVHRGIILAQIIFLGAFYLLDREILSPIIKANDPLELDKNIQKARLKRLDDKINLCTERIEKYEEKIKENANLENYHKKKLNVTLAQSNFLILKNFFSRDT